MLQKNKNRGEKQVNLICNTEMFHNKVLMLHAISICHVIILAFSIKLFTNMSRWNASNQFLYFYVITAEHFGIVYPNGPATVFLLMHTIQEGT